MPTRRAFVTAAALAPTRDAIGARPWWWTAPGRDPAGGYGYNHSNNLVITKERGIQMNRTPLTKEWCWLAP